MVVGQVVIGVVMMLVFTDWLRAVAVVNECEVSTGWGKVTVAMVADVQAESLSPEHCQQGRQGKEAVQYGCHGDVLWRHEASGQMEFVCC